LNDTCHYQCKHQKPHINPAFKVLEALSIVVIVSEEIIKEGHKEESIVKERESPREE